MKNLFLVFCVFLLCFASVFAQQSPADQDVGFDMNALHAITADPFDITDPAQDAQQFGRGQEPIGIIVLRIVGSLALVLAIVAVVAWGVRKSGIFGKGIAASTGQTPSMSVLEALVTGQGGMILLLRCEKQVFLVGQTPTNYTLLKELDEGAAQKIIESKGGNETIASFKNSLANFMQNVKVQKASAISTGRKV